MTVGDPSANERFRQSISVELRIRTRAGDRAHIYEQIDPRLPEQSHKFGDRARRMAYREDCRHRLGLSHRFANIYINISVRAGLGVTGAPS
jgi:hypothetical protein